MVPERRRVRRRRPDGGLRPGGGRLVLLPRALLIRGSTRRQLQLPLLGLYLQPPHLPPAPLLVMLLLLLLPPLLTALAHVLLVDERLNHLHLKMLCLRTAGQHWYAMLH